MQNVFRIPLWNTVGKLRIDSACNFQTWYNETYSNYAS